MSLLDARFEKEYKTLHLNNGEFFIPALLMWIMCYLHNSFKHETITVIHTEKWFIFELDKV